MYYSKLKETSAILYWSPERCFSKRRRTVLSIHLEHFAFDGHNSAGKPWFLVVFQILGKGRCRQPPSLYKVTRAHHPLVYNFSSLCGVHTKSATTSTSSPREPSKFYKRCPDCISLFFLRTGRWRQLQTSIKWLGPPLWSIIVFSAWCAPQNNHQNQFNP